MKVLSRLIVIASAVLLISCQPGNIYNDDETDCSFDGNEVIARKVTNRDYYPEVYDLFDNAEKTIYVIMYDMKYYDYDTETEEMKLLSKLAHAALRGVDVKILLEQSDWNEDVNEDNYASGAYLHQYGADVRYDSKTVTTHCKTMIIDSVYTLVGSTNWSKSAINYNNESNVLLRGDDIADDFIDYFMTLWENSFEREFK